MNVAFIYIFLILWSKNIMSSTDGIIAPQLISLTCSGSVLCLTDGCLCGKVMFCQHICKCPLCLHTYWKLISMVNYCAHFSSLVLITECQARLCPLPLLWFHRLVEQGWGAGRWEDLLIFIFFHQKRKKVKKFKRLGKNVFTLCSIWWSALLSSPKCLQYNSI